MITEQYTYISKVILGYYKSKGIKFCPYCTLNELHYYESNKRSDFEIDHIIPQAKDDYLINSIYNLLPTCHFCNSQMKSTKNILNKDIETKKNISKIIKIENYEDFLDELLIKCNDYIKNNHKRLKYIGIDHNKNEGIDIDYNLYMENLSHEFKESFIDFNDDVGLKLDHIKITISGSKYIEHFYGNNEGELANIGYLERINNDDVLKRTLVDLFNQYNTNYLYDKSIGSLGHKIETEYIISNIYYIKACKLCMDFKDTLDSSK